MFGAMLYKMMHENFLPSLKDSYGYFKNEPYQKFIKLISLEEEFAEASDKNFCGTQFRFPMKVS